MTTSVSSVGGGYVTDPTDPLAIFQQYQVTANNSAVVFSQLTDVPEINGGKKDDEEDKDGDGIADTRDSLQLWPLANRTGAGSIG